MLRKRGDSFVVEGESESEVVGDEFVDGRRDGEGGGGGGEKGSS